MANKKRIEGKTQTMSVFPLWLRRLAAMDQAGLRAAALEIAERRRRLDITQLQLQKVSGVNRITISKYESGAARNPTRANMVAIYSALSYCKDMDRFSPGH